MAIREQIVEYGDADAACKGFLAYDDTRPGPLPAILISHAWGGRETFFDDKARELARLGYAGFALDMYGGGRCGGSPETNKALMHPFIEDRALLSRRINAAVKAVGELPPVDARRIGAMGYCFGGLCVLDLARSGANVRGVVSLHGLLTAPASAPGKKIVAKVLVLHGHKDPMVPVDDVVKFEQEMTEANVDWQVHVYGRAMHAFMDPRANLPAMGLAHDADAERRATVSLLNFFEEVLR